MENESTNELQRLEQKIDAIYTSVEKTRKYFLIMTWVTIAMVVLPALALVFVIPVFLNTYTSALEGLI